MNLGLPSTEGRVAGPRLQRLGGRQGNQKGTVDREGGDRRKDVEQACVREKVEGTDTGSLGGWGQGAFSLPLGVTPAQRL